jgi:hypothetical protein
VCIFELVLEGEGVMDSWLEHRNKTDLLEGEVCGDEARRWREEWPVLGEPGLKYFELELMLRFRPRRESMFASI